MKRSRSKPLNQEMNLTNMIDVVFAILIVFLISAPLMSQGIKVDLPNAAAPTLNQDQKMLKVTIEKDEKIYIDENQVHLTDFSDIFSSRWRDEPVVINADESVNYGIVMKVVSLVQAAGVKQLGFLTLDKEKKK